jgi:signal transduction histidine kinase
MKFSWKLVIGTTLLIAVLFSAGGLAMTYKNYRVAFSNAVEQNTNQHILERYSMEASIRNALENSKEYSAELLADYADRLSSYGHSGSQLAIYMEDGKTAYDSITSNISQEKRADYMEHKKDTYMLVQEGSHKYMMIASDITMGQDSFCIMNAFDMSSIYSERNRQLMYFFMLDIIILLLAVGGELLLSSYLTAPISRLNRLSQEIASGSYSARTNINTSDEIGELSRSFDAMADAVEKQIGQLNEDIIKKEEFVADFSHELKTPMTSIMGYAKMLRNESLDCEERKVAAGYIYSECKRLEQLSKKLISLMKLGEGKLELGSVSARWAGERLSEIIHPLCGEVHVECDIESSYLKADGTLLLDLLKNLVENAIKSQPKDNKVIVNGKCSNGKYVFSIKDKGIGMDNEELKHIQEPFYMADKSRTRAQGGSGLGLSICRKICSCHGTSLSFESSKGEGTCVSFELEVPDDVQQEE